MATPAQSNNIVNSLQDMGVIPAGLIIQEVTIKLRAGELMVIEYQTLVDEIDADHVIEKLVESKDELTSKKVAERLKNSKGLG